jgi:hypothetical protein
MSIHLNYRVNSDKKEMNFKNEIGNTKIVCRPEKNCETPKVAFSKGDLIL